MPVQWILLGTLVACVAIQMFHRLAGAVATLLWSIALAVWGYFQIQSGAEIRLFFLRGEPKLFIPVMVCFIGYNTFVVVRLLQDRKRSRH